MIPMVVAAGHTRSSLWIQQLSEYFIPEVDRRLEAAGSRHKIAWTEAYGGSLAKLGGMLEAMEEGLVDMGIVATVFDAAKMPLQNVSYIVPFGSSDARVVTNAVMRLERDIPAMSEAWRLNNMKLLSGLAVDNYDLYTTFPVESVEDLAGRKILAPGPAANWIRGTGAIAVAGTLATYYNDLKTGVADGTLTLASGAYSLRLHEVTRYMSKVRLGSHFVGGLAINLDIWRSLPADVQRVLSEVGTDFTPLLAERTQERGAFALEEMRAAGLEVTVLAERERRRWAEMIPNTAETWTSVHESRGLPARQVIATYIDLLRSAGTELPRDWSRE